MRELGIWWRYDLSSDVRARLITTGHAASQQVSTNVLEVVALVVTTLVVVIQEGHHAPAEGGVLSAQADNTSAVGWARRGGGARSERAQLALRCLAAVELVGGWALRAHHIKGALNVESDGISRWKRNQVQGELQRRWPHMPWREVKLNQNVHQLIGCALASTLPDTASQQRLWQRIGLHGGHG